jgi:hypothetical protein
MVISPGNMNKYARQNAVQSAITAVIMLLYGFYLSATGWSSTVTDELYNIAMEVFKWTLKGGGAAMLVVAILCLAGQRVGLLLDCLVSGACGLIMAACGGIWMARGKGLDLQDIVVLVFGLIFMRAAWISWTLFAETPAEAPPQPPPEPEPIHPASIHPDVLPREGDAPPEEGFLAAMAKEKKEPPTASYE